MTKSPALLSPWVDPKIHTKAIRQGALPYILGIIFGLSGIALIYFAFTQFPFFWFTPVIGLVMISMVALEIYAVFRFQKSEGGLKKGVREKHEEEMAQGRVLSPAEFKARHQSRAKAVKLWLPLIAIIGIISVSGSLSLGQALLTLESDGLRADGQIVEVVREYRHHDGEYMYYPVVSFRHGGQDIQFQDSTGSNMPTFRTGQKVEILYHPKQPAKAIIDRGWLNWSATASFMLFGLLMLWITYRSYAGMRTKL